MLVVVDVVAGVGVAIEHEYGHEDDGGGEEEVSETAVMNCANSRNWRCCCCSYGYG